MPTTLTNGIQLPDKGSVDWYSSMQSNYNLIDTHLGDTDTHVTAEDKANWNSKQGSLSQAQLDAIAQVATNTSDIATLQSGKADASHTHSSSDIIDIGDYATKQYVDNSISGLVDNAPAALDTLKELSTALNDDANFASTVTTALSAKANSADLATVATSGFYNDLDNKPYIPDKISDLIDDSNFVDTSNPAVASGITSAKVTDYDSHIADTDTHVTTADKATWNTVTSKANDGNVVHTSGNETKSGELTLSDTLNSSDIVPIANNSYSSGSSNNQWNNIYSMNYYYNGVAWGLDKSNTWTSSQTYSTGYYGQMIWLKNTDLDLSVNGNTGLSSIYQHMIHWVDKNNAVYSSIQAWTASSETTLVLRSKYRTDANTIRELSVRFTSTATNKVIYPETNADTELGTSTNKWKSFNGLEPSSLSLPSGNASDFIDISSYFSNTGNGDTNSYTALANGWVYLYVTACSTLTAYVQNANNTLYSDYKERSSDGQIRIMLPIQKNSRFTSLWTTSTTVSISRAVFIPCQGNV